MRTEVTVSSAYLDVSFEIEMQDCFIWDDIFASWTVDIKTGSDTSASYVYFREIYFYSGLI